MPNNYFQFKQFTVHQGQCAMKVCTDACLFGSLIPAFSNEAAGILDIGTGTGLLALMCAQKSPAAIIDAVEIDEAASNQAAENFAASPWSERLKVHHTSIQQFALQINQRYNLIISNPPFFENDLKSSDGKRNLALHSEALSLEELIVSANGLLKKDGIFAVLLPHHRAAYFESTALSYALYLSQKILIKQTPKHPYFRSILFFSRDSNNFVEQEITIRDEANQYTPKFTELLRDYYLKL